MRHAARQGFYNYCYKYACEPGMKALQTDVAVEMWRLLLQDRFALLEEWVEFVKVCERCSGRSRCCSLPDGGHRAGPCPQDRPQGHMVAAASVCDGRERRPHQVRP